MTTTVILLNPMGADVTAFVPTLLRGEVMPAGATLYTLPYSNTSGIANIQHGVDLLDAKLNATSGTIRVFGYSEGCQVADKWLTDHGASTPIDPARLSFLLIGNADRKYGGFSYGQNVFSSVAYTGGAPAATPYSVVDFVRQYDPIGDFPSAKPMQDALAGLAAAGTGPSNFGSPYYATLFPTLRTVLASTAYTNAAINAFYGLIFCHEWYFDVAPSDAHNASLVEGNITYMWAPTYPLPIVEGWSWAPQIMQQLDAVLRPIIESAYHRPVKLTGRKAVSVSLKDELDFIEQTCDKLRTGLG